MAQFSVYKNPNRRSNADVPFLLDVQSDFLSLLATRVVVPLYRLEALARKPMARLTPAVRFQGKNLVAVVPELAGVPLQGLGKSVGELPQARSEILNAVDMVMTGF